MARGTTFAVASALFLTTLTFLPSASAPDATLRPPYSDWGEELDVPADGLFNNLVVDLTINVTVAATYDLWTYLYDGSGTVTISQHVTGPTSLPVGDTPVSLRYPGGEIVLAGIDGPYQVVMTLFGPGGMRDFQDSDIHWTAAYLWTDFQSFALLNPPHTDTGVDNSVPPNGLYDLLRVDISLQVATDWEYNLRATLYDPLGGFLQEREFNPTLVHGPATIIVNFTGYLIRQNGVDGPYRVAIALAAWITRVTPFGPIRSAVPIDAGDHWTAPYLASDFEWLPLQFTPPHADWGEDTDLPPNGLYDWLVVRFSMIVNISDTYQMSGYLYDSTWSFITQTEAIVARTPGPWNLELRFDGSKIWRHAVDGPYIVLLTALDSDGNLVATTQYWTAFYPYTAFDPPPAYFTPPHSETAVDTDLPPNGLYDELRIHVSLFVETADNYTVEGWLHDPFFRLITTASVAVPDGTVGSATVDLVYPGQAIHDSGYDGPYTVYLYIADTTPGGGDWVDDDTYETAPYSHLDFDTPPLPPWDLRLEWANGMVDLQLTWSDVNSTPVVEYRIYRAPDPQGPFAWMDTVPDTGGPYAWTDAGRGADVSNYFYRVRGYDGSEESPDSATLGKYVEDLVAGTNDVSLPFLPQNTSVDAVFASMAGQYSAVGQYRACTAGWQWSNATGPAELRNVNYKFGLRVQVTTSAAVLKVLGRVVATTATSFCAGANGPWNFVGYARFIEESLPGAINNYGYSAWDVVIYHDAKDRATPTKVFYKDPNLAKFNTLTSLAPGMGVWVHATGNGTWTVPSL